MKSRVVLQINELKDIGVFDELLRLHFAQSFGRFRNDGLLLNARQKPFIVQSRNLALKLATRPVVFDGFFYIPFTRMRVFHSK